MNIFVLDEDPRRAAQYHCDKHVSKMLLEAAQILSTVGKGPYKPTHKHHPCTRWAGESRANALWLRRLAYHLNTEWQNRYNQQRNHKSFMAVLATNLDNLPDDVPQTPFVLAMPDEFKIEGDPVASYRAYYHSKTFAQWNHGPTPHWWNK